MNIDILSCCVLMRNAQVISVVLTQVFVCLYV